MRDFGAAVNANISSVFYSAVAFLDLLYAAKSTHLAPSTYPAPPQIIVISSNAAFDRSWVSTFAYSASQAAVVHMTKKLSTCLSPDGIRCNVIAPDST
jgi:NAD(P)-dependent dehydrogenase (short-subunit alcohol dehydrogenase family)